MENTEIKQGGDIMLFATIDDKQYTLAFATSHKLTINAETTESTNKDNGGTWKSSTVKKLSWNVSSENLYVENNPNLEESQKGFGDIFDMLSQKKVIEVMLSPVINSADTIPTTGWQPLGGGAYKGKAIITSLEVNAPSGDNATYTVQLEGVGPLTHTISR